jgi:hypothetical protein
LPNPRGIEVICSPTPGATSYDGLIALNEAGAILRFSDGLHAKVYWTESEGCLITSANLSKSALAVDGLVEAGVVLNSADVDIDRLIKEASPHRPTKVEMERLRQGERPFRVALAKMGLREKRSASFVDWYESDVREPWKLGWWSGPATLATAARQASAELFGSSKAANWINCANGQMSPNEWVLMFKLVGARVSQIDWLYVDHVVRVSENDTRAYEEDYPMQAFQAYGLRSYPQPPFRLDSAFRDALQASATKFGATRIENLFALEPPKTLIREIHRLLSASRKSNS